MWKLALIRHINYRIKQNEKRTLMFFINKEHLKCKNDVGSKKVVVKCKNYEV